MKAALVPSFRKELRPLTGRAYEEDKEATAADTGPGGTATTTASTATGQNLGKNTTTILNAVSGLDSSKFGGSDLPFKEIDADDMSSYLENQRGALKDAISSGAAKAQNKRSIPKAPDSPSPSIGSTTSRNDGAAGTPPAKRKRQDIVYSQPENINFGDQIGTQMHFALTYLREKNEPKSLDDILGHLSLMKHPEQYKETFTEMIRRHPRVEFIPEPDVTEQKWDSGKYAYRPIIAGVKDKTSLLKFLQGRKDASGVAVKDLKDGWPDCEPALTDLEKEHKILVIRTKKENNPKHVYLDDPSLSCEIDPEFKTMWLRVPIPKPEELPRKLQAVGQKPTSEDPSIVNKVAAQKAKPQKKRITKRAGKVTNTHMESVLKDFSQTKR